MWIFLETTCTTLQFVSLLTQMGNFCLKALNQTIIDNLNEKSGRYKNKISMESDKALLEITMYGFCTI